MKHAYQHDIDMCIKALEENGVILYPTDTIWGLGCDATKEAAVKKIMQIKQRPLQKTFIVLVDSLSMLSEYVEKIPPIAMELIKQVETPLTIIYPGGKNLAQSLIAEDHTIAIRLIKDSFCVDLIKHYGRPIVSTSANISGQPAPRIFKEISPSIIAQVDYVVSYRQNDITYMKPSTIIRIKDDWNFEIIRD
ncbi:MAG: L-threonylcarbamoyladenylate synthase [Bacteroidales bacterium]|nr:L-threonylcarbamoyladenylate synthase [Bacteroidales bacterium]